MVGTPLFPNYLLPPRFTPDNLRSSPPAVNPLREDSRQIKIGAMKTRDRLAANIRRSREAKGWSQKALAERLGVTVPYISAVENGKENLTVDQLDRFADALGTALLADAG